MPRRFKEYTQNQPFLLPPSLEDLIPKNHLVRVVNTIIDEIDLSVILELYPGGGATAYHPVMMIKALVYAYIDNIRTSRKIAKALRENICYQWLSGMQQPDFRTINLFRSGRLRDEIKWIFAEVVIAAARLGLVNLKKLFVDGTKLEANSNKHKMVWRKNAERYAADVKAKIEDLMKEIDRLQEEEDRLYGDKDLPEVGEDVSLDSPEARAKIKEARDSLNQIIRRKAKCGKEITSLEQRREKYEDQQEALSGRNSYSKTDTDATAMKMKDETFKPAYNVMIGTENQVIVDYEICRNPNDGTNFIKLMEGVEELYGKTPETVIGDAAFGNEENYTYCEEKEITGCLKYSTFHLQGTKKFKESAFRKENFVYDKETDTYACPGGRVLELEKEEDITTSTGFAQHVKHYASKDCGGCEHKPSCTRGDVRTIQRNENLDRLKGNARMLLTSKEGKELRKERGVQVETPFGDLKQNHGFRRFLLRGVEKVNVEMGLMAIAHNFKKIYSKLFGAAPHSGGESPRNRGAVTLAPAPG